MLFRTPLLALAALAGLTIAAPVEEQGGVLPAVQEARAIAGTVSVVTYSGDSCSGSNDQVVVTDGGYRCFPVSNKRSISVSGKYVQMVPTTTPPVFFFLLFPSLYSLFFIPQRGNNDKYRGWR